jgi:hypothetical protein
MLSDTLFQEAPLTKDEEAVVIEIFSSPVVKKYLRMLGRNDLAELAALSVSNMQDSEVAKKHSLVQGKLSTIVTLLSFKK